MGQTPGSGDSAWGVIPSSCNVLACVAGDGGGGGGCLIFSEFLGSIRELSHPNHMNYVQYLKG